MENIVLICHYCGNEFTRSLKQHKKSLYKNKEYKPMCNIECKSSHLRQTLECDNCKTPFSRTKSSIGKSNFCSSSCAASYNNKHYPPKRKLTRTCTKCDNIVANYRTTLCSFHKEEHKHDRYRTVTVGEYRNKPSVKGKHPSWLNAHVRGFARSWLKDLTEMPCKSCGYEKHVELAHRKAVSSFGDDALLGEINSRENVIPLCRNCHWEFDNGLLEI